MKILNLLILAALTLILVSCGAKNESGGTTAAKPSSSSTFSSDPYRSQNVTGLINVDTLMIQIGSVTYQANQQTQAVVMQALDLSYRQNIQPNTSRMLKAKITASVDPSGNTQAVQDGYPYPGAQQPQPGYQTPYPSNIRYLNVTSFVIYR